MKTIVMTGATSGFGVEWFNHLYATEQATFFLLVRSEAKLQQLLNALPNRSKRVVGVVADLSSLQSIKQACEQIISSTQSIDLLINNAGQWGSEQLNLTEEGVEQTFAVNQLAAFYLTALLLPLLKKSQAARIVNTSSFRHFDAKVDEHDFELKNNYNAEQAYCNSKLYNLWFSQSLAEQLKQTQVTVNCFDPGIVDTPMLKQGFPKALRWAYPLFRRLVARSPAKGAETGIYLSQSEAVSGVSGQYFKDKKVHRIAAIGKNKMLRDKLWLYSESKVKAAIS